MSCGLHTADLDAVLTADDNEPAEHQPAIAVDVDREEESILIRVASSEEMPVQESAARAVATSGHSRADTPGLCALHLRLPPRIDSLIILAAGYDDQSAFRGPIIFSGKLEANDLLS